MEWREIRGILLFVTNTDSIASFGSKYVFTDGHAIMAWTEFYNDLVFLSEVDWSVMESRYWNDTDEFPDRKRRRQAEFLVYKSVPLTLFLGIGVYNERMRVIVSEILKEYNTDMKVLIRPAFYY